MYEVLINSIIQSKTPSIVTSTRDNAVCVTMDGVWIAEWIDNLYTRLGTTSNYSAIANLHNSEITTGPAN
jgi:hypothetical protein